MDIKKETEREINVVNKVMKVASLNKPKRQTKIMRTRGPTAQM